MRSVTRSVPSQGDSRNLLYGLQFVGVPCINSLQSIYCTLERPWVYGELKKIQQRLGKAAFPLIEQSYYPSHRVRRTTSPLSVSRKLFRPAPFDCGLSCREPLPVRRT